MSTLKESGAGPEASIGYRSAAKFSFDSRPLVITFSAVLLAVYLGAWEWAVQSGVVNRHILPAPSAVGVQLWNDVVSIVTGGFMAGHFLFTLQEIALGFGIALLFGVILGIGIAESKIFRLMVYPYIVAFNATPRVAFAPLFLIWFGFGIWSKVAMVVAIAAFPIIVGTIAGMAASDPAMDKLMRSLGATRRQAFWKVRMPLALPYIFAGVETGVILAIIGAIVGEFAGGSAGLGYIISVAQRQLNLAQAFSALIILSVFGVLLHQLVLIIQRRVIYWRITAS